ncbi:hypothetical protein MTQ13_22885, partial [Streptomyces sp. XM4011]
MTPTTPVEPDPADHLPRQLVRAEHVAHPDALGVGDHARAGEQQEAERTEHAQADHGELVAALERAVAVAGGAGPVSYTHS